jgi:type 2A phosphatase activator TIP41
MLFLDNVLRLRHADGFGLELNAVDALKTVNDHEDLVRVALSEKWLEAR